MRLESGNHKKLEASDVVMEYYSVFLIIRIPNNIRILAGIIRIVWTKFPKSTFWARFRPRTMYLQQIKGLNV